MKKAKPGDAVQFQGLKSALHLNGTRGKLVKYIKKEKRWTVRCYAGDVKTKPKNLMLLDAETMDVLPDDPLIVEALDDVDVLSKILSNLNWREILTARVCRKWRDAARLTDVPESETDDGWHTPELYLQNRNVALALPWISDALPKMHTVNIDFGLRKTEPFAIANGEDPAQTLVSSFPRDDGRPEPVDIRSIANLRHLQHLKINQGRLNGTYPWLFDFPNLRSLELSDVGLLKWNISVLSGMPKLEKIRCIRNSKLTGNLSSIRELRNLVELCLSGCTEIEGNLMDLGHFPRLRSISLNSCDKIVGDIRDIGPNNFQAIEEMTNLPNGVYGGGDLPSIADAPAVMRAWGILKKRNPKIFPYTCAHLSIYSPELFVIEGLHHSRGMPTGVEFVTAGPRLGWRWTNSVGGGGACETNWLDHEPDPSDEDYDVYIKELKDAEKAVDFFSGFYLPPTEEELLRLNSEIPLDPMLQMYSSRSAFRGW